MAIKRVLALTVALATLAVGGCKTAEQAFSDAGKKPMSAAQLKERMIGNTTCGMHAGGYWFCVHWRPDGTAGGVADQTVAAGTYEIKADGRTCYRWQNPYWPTNCVKGYPDGEVVKYFDEGGILAFTANETHKGNPKGL